MCIRDSVCVVTDAKLSSLFNEINQLVSDELHYDGLFYSLAQMALAGEPTSVVINAAADLMGNALILIDRNQKILASSNNFPIEDPLWADNVKRGYCSQEFVVKVSSSKDMKDWRKSGHSVQMITLEGDLQPKLVARVTEAGHMVSGLIMILHLSLIHILVGDSLVVPRMRMASVFFSICQSISSPILSKFTLPSW